MSIFKAACLAIGLATGALPAPAFAQGTQQETADKERALTRLLAEALPVSRLPEIYADLRQAMRDVYLPALRDTIKGNAPGQPALKDEERETLVKIEALFRYGLQASDELDPFLQESRPAMIADIARLQGKYMTLAEINTLGDALDMPATRKVFNAFYAASRLFTAYSYADMRSYYAQTAWLNELTLDLQAPSRPDATPPSAEKIAKAQAVMNDLLRISRLDDMVAEVVRFAKDVVAPSAGNADPDMLTMLEGMSGFYEFNKPIILATASSVLAVALTDEQLEQLHLLVLSPVMAKSFGLFYDAIRATTSLTKQDVQAMQAFSDAAGKKGLFRKRTPEEEQQLKQESQALADIWKDRAWSRLKPETRDGLDRAIKDIEKLNSEGTRTNDGDGKGDEDDMMPGVERL